MRIRLINIETFTKAWINVLGVIVLFFVSVPF